MNKIFNFLKQLFGFANTSNVEEVSSTIDNSTVGINTNVNTQDETIVNAEDEVSTSNFIDVFGNTLRPGEMVVPIIYNDSVRRGYYTLRKNYESLPAAVVLKPYIEYNKLQELIENGKVTDGRKHGFIHVAAN